MSVLSSALVCPHCHDPVYSLGIERVPLLSQNLLLDLVRVIWEEEVFDYPPGGHLGPEAVGLDAVVLFHERDFLREVLLAVLDPEKHLVTQHI